MDDHSGNTEPSLESYRELVEIHDRMFQAHSIQNSIYVIPVDDMEEERLTLQHQVLTLIFGNRLFLAPITSPTRVLECGYGTGSWAVDMAERYPDCEVNALDIYPMQLPHEPDNLQCECWDLNLPLVPTYKAGTYDFVHSRCVSDGLNKARWPSYVSELRKLLTRGGWVQLAEIYYNIQSDTGRLTDQHETYRWGQVYRTLTEKDRDSRIGRTLADRLREARFVNISSTELRIPIGDWPTARGPDEIQKDIGIRNKANVEVMIESLAIYPFTERLGWTAEQVSWMVQGARQEMEDKVFKLYLPVYVAWGQRP